ncbi:MAG: putative multidrug efflux protein [Chlamydiia bacterium]|nr:putative multidrug efflux protein [Chlamydiia bacterium]
MVNNVLTSREEVVLPVEDDDIPCLPKEIPGQLTSFAVGTTGELWTLAYPIMVSLLSVGVMSLANRVYLAQYSVNAFNAVSEAIMFFMTFEYTMVTLATISEVLVGKAFGAQDYHKVVRPVWAMIWMSIASSFLFLPLAFFGASYIFAGSPNKEYAASFFSTMCYFGPLFPLNAALSSFWIGRGKTGFVTCLVAISSVFNIILDPMLIFGFGIFPQLGVQGAALARGVSQLFLAGALLIAFLSKPNRSLFKTDNWRFDFSSFKQVFSYGSSQALSMLMQCAAWAMFFRIMSMASQSHVLACGISDAIYFFFSFAIEGVSKAVSSIVANLIGAGRISEIGRVAAAGIRFIVIFGVVLALFLFPAPDFILGLFLPKTVAFSAETHSMLRSSLIWIWLTLVGEALLYLWSGVLMAFGDTRFILVTSALFVWILGVGPAYMMTLHWNQPANIALAVACFYYLFTGVAYMLRVRYQLKALN